MARPPRIAIGMCIIAAYVVACRGQVDAPPSDPPIGPRPFANGSRLHAHVYDGGGGALQLVDWQDTQTGTRCFFAAAPDGRLHCMPEATSLIQGFLDAACTRPFTKRRACSPIDVAYAWGGAPLKGPFAPTCGLGDLEHASVWIYRVAARIATPAQTFAFNPDAAACVASASPVDLAVDEAVYEVDAAPVDPSAFVGATIVQEPRGDLLVDVITADDDSMQRGRGDGSGLFDRARNTRCLIDANILDDQFCMPVPIALTRSGNGASYGDAACTTQIVSWATDCAAPSIIMREDETACPVFTYYAPGAPLAPSEIFLGGQGSTCSRLTPSPGAAFFDLGSPFDMASLPHVQVARAGSGRLRLWVRRLGDGAALFDRINGFYDVERGESCWPENVGGEVRCVPNVVVDAVYSDSACTMRAAYDQARPCLRARFPARISATSNDAACGWFLSDFHELGSVLTGPIFVRLTDGSCVEQPRGPGNVVYSIGAAIDPAAFAPLIDRVL